VDDLYLLKLIYAWTVLLILVSQRVEIPIPGLSDKVASDLDKIKLERRGAPATMVEWMILAYVAGNIAITIVTTLNKCH
jgi:hypothetical protein